MKRSAYIKNLDRTQQLDHLLFAMHDFLILPSPVVLP